MPHLHRIRVRYGECDMQGVVFNANYLAYVDDATDSWFRSVLGNYEQLDFDCMVKRCEIEWQSAARFADELDLAVAVTRWGRTSFDVDVVGAAGERPVFTAHLIYVSTTPGAPVPVPVPDRVRELLTEASR